MNCGEETTWSTRRLQGSAVFDMWVFLLTKHTKMYYIIYMEERLIIWDEVKNIENKKKHKIGFEVAQYVFSDPLRIWRPDRSDNNMSGETRWQTIGKVGKIIFVVYTEKEEDLNTTRLISAREAEKHERRSYNGYYQVDSKGWTKDT